ncbi:hypothetical protein DFH28DRAFT_929533 [Melampsora americana]|nr:hypothetical protein DFH28DRAFT_929533 [Melampsora americana]
MYEDNYASSVSESKSITSIVQPSQLFTINPFTSQKWEGPIEHPTSGHTLTTAKSFEMNVPDLKVQPDFRAYVSKIRSAPSSLSFSKLKSRVKGSRERRNSEFQAFIPMLGTHPNSSFCETSSQYAHRPTLNTRRSSMSSSNNSEFDSSSQSSETSSLCPPRSASIVEDIEEVDDDEIGFSIIKLQLSAQRIGRQRIKDGVLPRSPGHLKPRQHRAVISPLQAELSISFDSPFTEISTTNPTNSDVTIETPPSHITQRRLSVQSISLQALSDFALIEGQCDGDDDEEVDQLDDEDDGDHSSFYTLSGDNSDDEDEEFFAPQWPN